MANGCADPQFTIKCQLIEEVNQGESFLIKGILDARDSRSLNTLVLQSSKQVSKTGV